MTYDPNHPPTPEPGVAPSPAVPAALATDPGAPAAWPAATPTGPVAAGPVTSDPAAVIPAARSRGSGGRILNIVLGIAIAVAIGGVAFAVGRTTAPASAATTGRGGFGTNNANASFAPRGSGAPGFGGRGAFGGFGGAGLTIRGTVESVDSDSVTIKTPNGQTIEVSTGADTTYNTETPASATDVTEGKTVQVQIQPTNGANGGGLFRPGASGAPSGPVGTAGSITVIP
ncbi:MAG: hypothetical protein ACJ778_09260 [Chloroflexota bacterium]